MLLTLGFVVSIAVGGAAIGGLVGGLAEGAFEGAFEGVFENADAGEAMDTGDGYLDSPEIGADSSGDQTDYWIYLNIINS